jgi:Zn-dependent peptidase ImmA (M78 family)
MVTRVPAERHVLKWARDACGLTIEAAAELLGCKPDLLRAIEDGTKLPSASMFRDMASYYGFPEATLLAATPPELPEFPKDHRTFDGVAAQLSYRTIIAIRGVQMRQQSIKELSEIDPEVIAPAIRSYRRTEDPEDVAAAERRHFAVAISDQLKFSADKLWMAYRMRIEALGISVCVEDFPSEDCRGISLFVDEFPAIIISNNERRAAWKLFSLMHEYAHILIRETGISDQRRATRDPIEAFCNKFAAAFLMPERAIETVLAVSRDTPQEFGIKTLEEKAHVLCVSISALALRLEDLGYAPPGYFNRIKNTISPPSIIKAEAGQVPQQYKVLNRYGHRFTSDVLQSVQSGALTKVEASRMLQANPNILPAIDETISTRRRDYLYGGEQV